MVAGLSGKGMASGVKRSGPEGGTRLRARRGYRRGLSPRTDKLLIGLFSDKTLSIVEGHTGLSFRTTPTPEPRGRRSPRRATPTSTVP